MGLESVTQSKLDELLAMSKRVTNPNARETEKYKHKSRNFKVVDNSGDHTFSLFMRQSTEIEDDFSCGLLLNMPSGETLTLARYNGCSHSHKNHIENEKLEFSCHIHKATEKYIQAGKKAEGYAETTDRYRSVEGALHCLMLDWNISGMNTKEDLPTFL